MNAVIALILQKKTQLPSQDIMNKRNQPCKSEPEIYRMCFFVAIIPEAIDNSPLSSVTFQNKK